MTILDIAHARLCHQQIAGSQFTNPREVVSWLGALQSQDYLGALWSVGLRLPGSTKAAIEQAIADKTIVRTWPMRGTLHFVAAEDIRWMLALLAPRIIAGSVLRCQRLELDACAFSRSYQALSDALQSGEPLARKEVLDVLERAGVSTAGQRGYHVLWRAAQEGLICLGPRSGKQQTFVLLDDWLPAGKTLSREEALAEIAQRYFTSHGPATLQDFLWWTGLTAADGRAALGMAAPSLAQETVEGRTYWMSLSLPERRNLASEVYLLPGFDEYLLGYQERSAVLDPAHALKIVPGSNGIFMSTFIVEGRVAGTWERTLKKDTDAIAFTPFATLTKAETLSIRAAAERYQNFLAMPPPAGNPPKKTCGSSCAS